jgi:hypothetical protein
MVGTRSQDKSPAATINYRPILSSERAQHIEKTANVKIISKEMKEKLVAGPRWRPDTRTDWPTDRRS